MNDSKHRYMMIENIATLAACAVCVTGLAAFTDGYWWGFGFVILGNINLVRSE